jgi:hypothetical protein
VGSVVLKKEKKKEGTLNDKCVTTEERGSRLFFSLLI